MEWDRQKSKLWRFDSFRPHIYGGVGIMAMPKDYGTFREILIYFQLIAQNLERLLDTEKVKAGRSQSQLNTFLKISLQFNKIVILFPH